MEKNFEIVKEQFEKIPQVLKQHIMSGALKVNIDEILSDHPLQNIQKENYRTEVMLVLLQLESVEEFTVNIKHGMEIAMKRAEEISKRTKQLIFLPVQDFLIQKAYVETSQENVGASDIVAPKKMPKVPQKGVGRIDHEIPLVDIEKKREEPKEERPVVAPTPEEVVPTAKEKVLQTPTPKKQEGLDVFKKRLQEPVHKPIEENVVDENGRAVANTNPSTKEAIQSDPYKESID